MAKTNWKNKEIVIGGVSTKDRLILVRQLYAGIRAGYGVADSLDLAREQAKGRLKQVLESISENVRKGSYLYESFALYPKYFSPLFVNLIKTGELSGSLEESLGRLFTIMDKEREFKLKVRSAMTYPTFVLIAVVGLGLSVAIFILPNLLPLFRSLDIDLPVSTQVLLFFAELFENYGRQVFWGFIFTVIALVWVAHRKFSRPVTHYMQLKMPLMGSLYRKIMMARFSRTLESLLGSGIPIDEGLEISSDVITNHYYQNAIRDIIPLVKKGSQLGEAIKKYPLLFDDLFVKMLALGENTGGLESSFGYIGDYLEEETDHQMKNLSTSLEPILLIFVGLLVGFVAISILGPIYSITGNIR